MKLAIGILLLVGLAIVATSPTFLKLRRARLIGVLVGGGWIGLAIGLLIGPNGIEIIDQNTVIRASPLLTIGLCWIGLMIGLQMRRELLHWLPNALIRLALIDAVVSFVMFGAIAVIGLALWVATESRLALVAPALVIACGAIGWTVETRSLKLGGGKGISDVAMSLRASASLASPATIVIFGLGTAIVSGTPSDRSIELLSAVFRLTGVIAIAMLLGVVVRFGLQRAAGNRSELLVIFLGVVALIAGVANQLSVSPLLAALIAGIVIANLAGKELRQFERFIIQAEHTVAILFSIIAGVLIDPRIGAAAVTLALTLAAMRILIKPALTVRAFHHDDHDMTLPELRRPLRFAPIRQSPIALLLGVSLILSQPSVFNQRLLAVVALTGLLAECFAIAGLFWKRPSPRDAERGTQRASSPQVNT